MASSTTTDAGRFSNGNVPALRSLVTDWTKGERGRDPRLEMFLERLQEMEAIELEHGGFSLGVFQEEPQFRIALPRRRYVERNGRSVLLS
jgi:hypothetical protein